MSLLIWPGAKFEMDTATGRHSSHLELSMVLEDYICHSRTSRLRRIFSVTSFHDVWKFNSCDYVLKMLLVGLVCLRGFLNSRLSTRVTLRISRTFLGF